MKVFIEDQGEWEKKHVRSLTEKTKSRYVEVEQEISSMHKVINLSFWTKWLEMCFQRISICNCMFNEQNISKYTKLYDEGYEKL
jgi:desulfoferrodoxin (superoxide reductase-like protein)